MLPCKHLTPVASMLCELAHNPEHLCALGSFQENRLHKINAQTGPLLTYAELMYLTQRLHHYAVYHSHYYDYHFKRRVGQGQ